MSERPVGERLASRELFSGRAVTLALETVRLPNGRTTDLEIIHHQGAVAVLPVIGEDVLLVRQYRYATGGWLLEVPAGTLDPGEEPEACAIRETEEETGFRPSELKPLGWIWTTPGFADEKIWLFVATGLQEGRQALDEDEVLELERLPLRAAVEKAVRGEIHDGKTVCTLLLAARHLNP